MSSIQIIHEFISRQPRLVSSRRMRQFSFNSLKYFVIAPCRREYVDKFSSLYPPLSRSLFLPLLLSPLSTRQICLICGVFFSQWKRRCNLQWNYFAYDERFPSWSLLHFALVCCQVGSWLIPNQKWLRAALVTTRPKNQWETIVAAVKAAATHSVHSVTQSWNCY